MTHSLIHSFIHSLLFLVYATTQQEERTARTEELEAKVDQLTQLLRTVTAPIVSPRVPVPRIDGINSASAFTAIKGGGRGLDMPNKKIIEF